MFLRMQFHPGHTHDRNRHYAERDGLKFMTDSPLLQDGTGRYMQEDASVEVIVTGIHKHEWIDGSVQHIVSVRTVDRGNHMLVAHDGWYKIDGSKHVGANFPSLSSLVRADRKSRIIRFSPNRLVPGMAWVGRNPTRGYYIAGLERLDDLYIPKEVKTVLATVA